MTYYITQSGKRIDIQNIKEDDICLQDIAHHLTKICRFGGALPFDKHYSVAVHSINLLFYARRYYPTNTELQKALLFHDASEAYLGDVVTGVKKCLPDYIKLEKQVSDLIYKKYDISMNYKFIYDTVRELDIRILLDEASSLFPSRYDEFKNQLNNYNPLGVSISPNIPCQMVYDAFLRWCNELEIKD